MRAENKYRIRNWTQYNRSLIKRGSISVWFSDDAIKNWSAEPKGMRGRPPVYSDQVL